MCVAIGRKLIIMQWRHSAAWTAWCPGSDTDTVEGFQIVKELTLPEQPYMMTVLNSTNSSEVGNTLQNEYICVGYKHHWEIVNERSGQISRLYSIEGTKANLVAALDFYEDQEIELLLCYNSKYLCADYVDPSCMVTCSVWFFRYMPFSKIK